MKSFRQQRREMIEEQLHDLQEKRKLLSLREVACAATQVDCVMVEMKPGVNPSIELGRPVAMQVDGHWYDHVPVERCPTSQQLKRAA